MPLIIDLLSCLYSEVRQSLSNAQAQYSQWSMLLDSEVDIDKIQNVGTELKNCIKSIEWDLDDLDQTISKLLCPQLSILAVIIHGSSLHKYYVFVLSV